MCTRSRAPNTVDFLASRIPTSRILSDPSNRAWYPARTRCAGSETHDPRVVEFRTRYELYSARDEALGKVQRLVFSLARGASNASAPLKGTSDRYFRRNFSQSVVGGSALHLRYLRSYLDATGVAGLSILQSTSGVVCTPLRARAAGDMQ